jgi:hypothetical protein
MATVRFLILIYSSRREIVFFFTTEKSAFDATNRSEIFREKKGSKRMILNECKYKKIKTNKSKMSNTLR